MITCNLFNDRLLQNFFEIYESVQVIKINILFDKIRSLFQNWSGSSPTYTWTALERHLSIYFKKLESRVNFFFRSNKEHSLRPRSTKMSEKLSQKLTKSQDFIRKSEPNFTFLRRKFLFSCTRIVLVERVINKI